MANKHIAYVINHVAFFVSHRLPIALAARRRGWEVTLITGQAGSPSMEALAVEELKRHGITHRRLAFQTAGLNPFRELAGLVQLVLCLASVKPAVVHAASPKGGLYGGIAARLAGVPALVIAISGMGSLFTGNARGMKSIARSVYVYLLRWVYRHPNKLVIVQNPEDEASVHAWGLLRPSEICLIPGSGVDLQQYLQIDERTAGQLVVLPARLLREKGVEVFVNAARLLKKRGCTWRFALIGAADYANPEAVPLELIKEWVAEGTVEWWGHREDMPQVFAQAAIVCLPSYYREGMPKCLLEAAAAGRPVVTCDLAGCRDAVIASVTADLVPPRDITALADTLQALIDDPKRRARYGAAGRELAVQRYGIESVIEQTLGIYERLTANVGP